MPSLWRSQPRSSLSCAVQAVIKQFMVVLVTKEFGEDAHQAYGWLHLSGSFEVAFGFDLGAHRTAQCRYTRIVQ